MRLLPKHLLSSLQYVALFLALSIFFTIPRIFTPPISPGVFFSFCKLASPSTIITFHHSEGISFTTVVKYPLGFPPCNNARGTNTFIYPRIYPRNYLPLQNSRNPNHDTKYCMESQQKLKTIHGTPAITKTFTPINDKIQSAASLQQFNPIILPPTTQNVLCQIHSSSNK